MRGGSHFLTALVLFWFVPATAQTLVWSDEFDYFGTPDPARWHMDVGDNWPNGEVQRYTNRLENARVEGGELIIEARKDGPAEKPYTSARVVSEAHWLYGKIEIRAKMPGGQGTWPAIWMLPKEMSYGQSYWPDNGEIDIAEHIGREPDSLYTSLHTKNLNWMHGTGVTQIINLPTAISDYHVYGLEWTPDYMIISIDGVAVNTFVNPKTNWGDWPFDKSFFLILNLALGGGFAGDLDETVLPRQLRIDYVRVYETVPAMLARAD